MLQKIFDFLKKLKTTALNFLERFTDNGIKGLLFLFMLILTIFFTGYAIYSYMEVFSAQREVKIDKQESVFKDYQGYALKRQALGNTGPLQAGQAYAIYIPTENAHLLLDFSDKEKTLYVGKYTSASILSDPKQDSALEKYKHVSLNDLPPEDKHWVMQVLLSHGAQKSLGLPKEFTSILANVLIIMLLLMAQESMFQSKKKLKFIQPNEIKGDINDLVGMEDVKNDVTRVEDFLKNRDLFKSYGIDKPQNILFSGPPGTGKTKLAGFLAKKVGLPILFHSAANLETGFVNGGVSVINEIVKKSKKMGTCIVFLDEAQDLFMKRGKSGRKFEDDTQNSLLAILDGIQTNSQAQIIWIVASNFNEGNMEMDEAMLRRFPMKVDFRLPNAEEREAIIQHYLNRLEEKNKADDMDLSLLVNLTERRSPADLETIVQDASVVAVRENRPLHTNDLLLSAERLLMGVNNEETTAHLIEEKRQIATHEIGHFLMEFINAGGKVETPLEALSKLKVMKISLKANARTGALGFVFKKPSSGFLSSRKDIEANIQTLFAGTVNEVIFYGEHGRSNGAINDIKEASKLLFHAVVEARLYNSDKVNFSALQSTREHAFVSDEDRTTIKKISETLYKKTEDQLQMMKELSSFLVSELLISTEMTAEEMLQAMSKYSSSQLTEQNP